MSDTLYKLLTPVLSATVGFLIGWSAQALTLTGRVAAIEAALPGIVQRLDQLVLGMHK